MPGKFSKTPFSKIDLKDPFFDSLKHDYSEFSEWYEEKAQEGREALIFRDEQGLGAFISIKPTPETGVLSLREGELPAAPRLKISTIRLAERFRGQRLGEGALGLILWEWQASKIDEIYTTVFPSHDDLIQQLERFGFRSMGHTTRGEILYLRSRKHIDFSDPYKSFPFLSPKFQKGGYLIVNDSFHDTLFPYSTLKNTIQEQLALDAANGLSKVYIGEQTNVHYKIGEPVFIYRKYCGPSQRRYKSCLTSFCVVTDIICVKRFDHEFMSFEDFCASVGNKSVFSPETLKQKFENSHNLMIIKLLYCGFFGSGNNINMDWLERNGFWCASGTYPTGVKLSPMQCKAIMREGNIDVDNVLGR